MLLAAGAEILNPNKYGESVFYTAASEKGNVEMLRTIIAFARQRGAAANYIANFATKRTGDTPLIAASRIGDVEMVKYLLNPDVGARALGIGEYTHEVASFGGNLRPSKFPRHLPADNLGRTALSYAAEKDNVSVVMALLQRKADREALSKADFTDSRKTPIDYAPAGSQSRLILEDTVRTGDVVKRVDIGKDEYVPKVGLHSEL